MKITNDVETRKKAMMRHIGFKNRRLYIRFDDEPKFWQLNRRGKMKRLRNLLPIRFFPEVYPNPKCFLMLPRRYFHRWCMISLNKWI